MSQSVNNVDIVYTMNFNAFVANHVQHYGDVRNLRNAISRRKHAMLPENSRRELNRTVSTINREEKSRTTQQVVRIMKHVVDLVIVGSPRVGGFDIYYSEPDVYYNQGNIKHRPGDDILYFDYDGSKFEMASEGGKKATFKTRAELVEFLERLAQRAIIDVISLDAVNEMTPEWESIIVYRINTFSHNAMAQRDQVARRRSAARKISRAFLNALHDPTHPIGKRRLVRQFEEELAPTLRNVKKPNTLPRWRRMLQKKSR